MQKFAFDFVAFLGSLSIYYIGIGRGIAIKLAECGAQVVAISRTPADLDSLRVKVRKIAVVSYFHTFCLKYIYR